MTPTETFLAKCLELSERATKGPWSVLDEKSILFGPANYIEFEGRRRHNDVLQDLQTVVDEYRLEHEEKK